MKVLSFCFCKDQSNNFGLVREYANGLLRVTFDDGDRWIKPSELIFP